MSDPSKGDLGDWALTILAGILIGIVSGLGAAMRWFKESKARLYTRIDDMEEDMHAQFQAAEHDRREALKTQTGHAIQLGILTTCQANIEATLKELKQDSDKQNDKLDQLLREQRRG